MTGTAIFMVCLKLFARAKIVHVVGWDDFFIILSVVTILLPALHTWLLV